MLRPMGSDVPERKITGRTPDLKPQRLVQRSVTADGKALQILQALVAAQDPVNHHQ
jgi:hypothetical protein